MKTRCLAALIFVGIFHAAVVCQSSTNPAVDATRTSADETFELNIPERRITRENFAASTAVRTDGSGHLDLQIGVGVAATRIEVLLRNVQGKVRFQGNLDRVLRLLDFRTVNPPRAAP